MEFFAKKKKKKALTSKGQYLKFNIKVLSFDPILAKAGPAYTTPKTK